MGEGKLPVDWGMAENLAYATLVAAGYNVRVSGEDVGRGTFFHRHAVLHDQNREKVGRGHLLAAAAHPGKPGPLPVLRLGAVRGSRAGLRIRLLATAAPNELVVWEAQFGDFANGAQVVIDQFIASGEAKWGRGCGLVMLLPHGYEGQGPEHSSARLERYMQLSAENWEVCVPSNAGADLPHAAPADAAQAAQAADRHDAEIAAAPQGRHQFARGTGQRAPSRPSSARSTSSMPRRSRAWSPVPARSTSTCSPRVAKRRSATSRWCASSSCIPSMTAACSRRWRSTPTSRN
jgi:hypothetical protein